MIFLKSSKSLIELNHQSSNFERDYQVGFVDTDKSYHHTVKLSIQELCAMLNWYIDGSMIVPNQVREIHAKKYKL